MQNITVHNVSKCSTFELRQELIKRKCLDIPEEKINYKSMLQRLMQELVKEQNNLNSIITEQKTEEYALLLKTAQESREQKKMEALERSRQRQADANYFKNRIDNNSQLNKTQSVSLTENDKKLIEINSTEDEEKENFEEDVSNDPFRTKKFKSKIHVN
jgi:hypothetical protein